MNNFMKFVFSMKITEHIPVYVAHCSILTRGDTYFYERLCLTHTPGKTRRNSQALLTLLMRVLKSKMILSRSNILRYNLSHRRNFNQSINSSKNRDTFLTQKKNHTFLHIRYLLTSYLKTQTLS